MAVATKVDKLLAELVALPSVNPAFLPPGDPRAGEQRVAEWVADVALRAGLDVESQPVFPRRVNVLARLTPAGRVRHRILLAPHLDTVGPPDSTPTAFTPRRKGRRLYGRGSCDTKGSVAAMLAAVCDVAGARRRPARTEIVFAGLADEESSQAGSRVLAARGPKADLVIVGEPTRLEVVTAHKGMLWLALETRGKAAHGARPELGRNAVRMMARVVEVLEGEYAAGLRRRRHPILGHATVNVGYIHGGTQANIVPDTCVISVDRRTLPGENHAAVKREMVGLLRRRKCAVHMHDLKRESCRPMETDPRSPWVRQFLGWVKQKRPAGVDFFTDAGVLAGGGMPCVVFGPGDIAQAHTVDEWIDLDALEQGRRTLAGFLASLP